jgi:hypothetical protein
MERSPRSQSSHGTRDPDGAKYSRVADFKPLSSGVMPSPGTSCFSLIDRSQLTAQAAGSPITGSSLTPSPDPAPPAAYRRALAEHAGYPAAAGTAAHGEQLGGPARDDRLHRRRPRQGTDRWCASTHPAPDVISRTPLRDEPRRGCAHLTGHDFLSSSSAALPIETGAELAIGTRIPGMNVRVSESKSNRAAVATRSDLSRLEKTPITDPEAGKVAPMIAEASLVRHAGLGPSAPTCPTPRSSRQLFGQEHTRPRYWTHFSL